ncbi:MAG: hypothetical protein ABI614_22650, partial [Planctomycetota bacterium]
SRRTTRCHRPPSRPSCSPSTAGKQERVAVVNLRLLNGCGVRSPLKRRFEADPQWSEYIDREMVALGSDGARECVVCANACSVGVHGILAVQLVQLAAMPLVIERGRQGLAAGEDESRLALRI